MTEKKIVLKPSGASLIDFIKSSKFGSALLILSTALEGFYSFSLFSLTGVHTFGTLTLAVSIIYSLIISGTIVFFALRNNKLMVYCAVGFEFLMNSLLDVQTVIMTPVHVLNMWWVFTAQLAIGALLPIATKAFADEINKREMQRNTSKQ